MCFPSVWDANHRVAPLDSSEKCHSWTLELTVSWDSQWREREGRAFLQLVCEVSTASYCSFLLALACLWKLPFLWVYHSSMIGLGTAGSSVLFGLPHMPFFHCAPLCVSRWTYHVAGHTSFSCTLKWQTKCFTLAAYHQMKMNAKDIHKLSEFQQTSNWLLCCGLFIIIRYAFPIKFTFQLVYIQSEIFYSLSCRKAEQILQWQLHVSLQPFFISSLS